MPKTVAQQNTAICKPEAVAGQSGNNKLLACPGSSTTSITEHNLLNSELSVYTMFYILINKPHLKY